MTDNKISRLNSAIKLLAALCIVASTCLDPSQPILSKAAIVFNYLDIVLQVVESNRKQKKETQT
jgi:hypothetical protein